MAPHKYHTNKWWTLIAACCNLGGYSSIISGLFYDAMQRHNKMGPRLTLLIGALATSAGYLGLWAAVTGRFQAAVWQVAGLGMLAASGGTFFDTAALVTSTRNFSHHRGHVVAVLKAAVGLSAALYATIYVGLLAPDAAAYLMLLATMPSLLALVACLFANVTPYIQDCELERGQHVFTTEGRFLLALQTLGTLALYLMASSLYESSHPGLPPGERITITVGAAILLLPLLLIPHGSGGLHVRRAHVPAGHTAAAATNGAAAALPEAEQPLLDGPRVPRSAAAAASEAELSAAMPCLSPRQCLSSPEFWLLFACCVAGMGSGLVFTNNLAQYWLSLGGAPDGHTIFLSLFSITNTAGRMAMGWLPESALHAFGTPRPAFLVLAALACAATCLGLALATAPPLLYPLSLAMGLCFGSFWSLMPSLASELFGLPNFASNYTLLQLAPAFGSFGLSLALVSFFYQRALARHGGGGSTCVGADCFRPTWATLAALGLLGSAAALALFLRTRRAYRRVHAAARQADEDLCSLRPHHVGPPHIDNEERSPSPGSTRPPSPPPLLAASVAAALARGLDGDAV